MNEGRGGDPNINGEGEGIQDKIAGGEGQIEESSFILSSNFR